MDTPDPGSVDQVGPDEPPTITRLGTLEELTQSGLIGANDGLAGGRPVTLGS